MEDNINQNTSQSFTGENPYNTTPPMQTAVSQTGPGSLSYAGFWERFIAVILDALIVGIPMGILQTIFKQLGETMGSLGGLLGMVIPYVYSVYFISNRGQTIGKQLMNIRVQKEDTGENLDVVSAILREVVGKILSAIILLLGYLWMLWDPKKQTWHDKIARSVVVKVK